MNSALKDCLLNDSLLNQIIVNISNNAVVLSPVWTLKSPGELLKPPKPGPHSKNSD
jgi:hypothetical protein